MKPGDAVKHKPSGETWLVAAVSEDGKRLICCGWPESMADVNECELEREATEAEAVELAEQVVKQCGDQCRGSWAREWLRKRKGGE